MLKNICLTHFNSMKGKKNDKKKYIVVDEKHYYCDDIDYIMSDTIQQGCNNNHKRHWSTIRDQNRKKIKGSLGIKKFLQGIV